MHLPQAMARIEFLRAEVRRWETFIADQGGHEAYVRLYGHSRDAMKLGRGGNHLHDADHAQLEILRSRLRQEEEAMRAQLTGLPESDNGWSTDRG